MKRLIRSGDQEGRLEFSAAENGSCQFTLAWNDDHPEPQSADVVEVEPGVYSVLLNGRSYEVKITPSQARWAVDVDGRHFLIECVDPRAARLNANAASGGGPLKLVAPMPGKVVRVLVEEGDEVAAGQGVVIVEAMKMQNEMKAPREGRVRKLLASPGATVAAGETLAILE